MNISRSITRGMLAVSLSLAITPVWAQSGMYPGGNPYAEDKGADMLLDVVVVRPLELATGIVGAALWIVTLPFSLPAGNPGAAGQQFFVNPMEYTFARPIGEWHVCGGDKHPC
jgi:hypothetical protein